MNWFYENTKNKDVVISSRVRLARNLTNYPFSQKLTRAEADKLINEVIKTIPLLEKRLSKNISGYTLSSIKENEKNAMVERHVVSPQLIQKKQSAGLLLSEDEKISIMINEEDHLRIQSITNGMNINEAFVAANKVDDILSESLDYAFHDKYGYLTSCPTNLGTGIRASYMLFLPALTLTNSITKMAEELSKYGITLRGTYGEGTKTIGYLYQISNQKTLGRTEEEIIAGLNEIVEQVVSQERSQRESYIKKNFHDVEDRIYRSYGVLKYARVLTSSDALTLLAQIKLGIDTNLIKLEKDCNIYELMVRTQPGNLQHYANEVFSSSQRDRYRAEYIRNNLPDLIK
ncbi:MAG: protein arginine kinase [Clostridiales bacterium]|nr:protein arginine kinase [Clostridiales bacterium]